MKTSELINVLIKMKEARKEKALCYSLNTKISKIAVSLIDAEIKALKLMLD